jgi:oxygen-dependent protoporphyrinogen oxidase
VGQALDGFGLLIPAKEKKSFLGAISSSIIFQQRADDQHVAFTMFIGGA